MNLCFKCLIRIEGYLKFNKKRQILKSNSNYLRIKIDNLNTSDRVQIRTNFSSKNQIIYSIVP